MEISFKIPHPLIAAEDQLLPGAESQMMRPAIQPVMIISARPAFDNGTGFRENSLSDAALVVFVHSEHRKSGHAVRLELSHKKKQGRAWINRDVDSAGLHHAGEKTLTIPKTRSLSQS